MIRHEHSPELQLVKRKLFLIKFASPHTHFHIETFGGNQPTEGVKLLATQSASAKLFGRKIGANSIFRAMSFPEKLHKSLRVTPAFQTGTRHYSGWI